MNAPQKILVLLAHPVLERSRIHSRLINHVQHLEGLTVHDLYEKYPDFNVDVKAEQKLLLDHDIIIWQHPFYWYSAPPLLKQWLDLVLTHGWAYGKGGDMLKGKAVMNAISCGGSENAYREEGRNRFTVRELLAPFDQTAYLCGMKYLPPFIIHDTYKLQQADMDMYAIQYEQVLTALLWNRAQEAEYAALKTLNELCPIPKNLQQ